MDTRGYKMENRTQALCQKFVGFSLLEPLKISKMRIDENIIKKPTHSLKDSNWPNRKIASKAANNGSKQARKDARVAPMSFAPWK